jgi:hypothetical protein
MKGALPLPSGNSSTPLSITLPEKSNRFSMNREACEGGERERERERD